MSGNYEAFSSRVVLHSLQKKVEAVEVWEDKVLAGMSDGTLMVLQADEASPESPFQVVKAMRAFGKKGFSQLQVWRDKSMLLCLDEDGVSLYQLPAFKLHCQANRSRYAQCFAWNPQNAMLAVSVKRKVLLFHFNGNEFVELKDLSIADSASCTSWLGEQVCIGYRKEYALLNVDTGALTDLFKSPAICMTRLTPADELLVTKGNVGSFLLASGRVSRRLLLWSDTPVKLAYSRPYALAFFSGYVEIRPAHHDSANALAQVIPIKDLTECAPSCMSDGSVVVASGMDGSIHLLRPLPLKQQAESMAALGELQEALRLASFIPASQAKEKQEVMDRLRILVGHHEFEEGDYQEAMAQFGMCSNANPVTLLNLFPSLASKELLEPLQDTVRDYQLQPIKEPEGEKLEQAVEVVLPYLLSYRGRLAAQRQEQSSTEREEDNAHISVEQDLGNLGDPELQIQAADQGDKQSLSSRSTEDVEGLTDAQRSNLECAVDTAILKAMLATKDSGALLRFAQGPNFVDLREGEVALKSKGRYAELVGLYKARGQHAQALNILKAVSLQQDLAVAPQGAAAEWAGMTGAWATVRYVMTMGSKEIDLIKRHARWILDTDPEAGLDMFVQISDILPPSLALPILTAHASTSVAAYLEACLERGTATPQEFDHELASLYLNLALEDQENDAMGPKRTEEISEEGLVALDKLKQLIFKSKFVEPQRLLLMLPEDQLYEVRALLLEQLGMYKKALRLYVHTMHSPALAEAYCDRLYKASVKHTAPSGLKSYGSSSNFEMYLTLIQVYLEGDDESEKGQTSVENSNWKDVAQLLARKYNIIEPSTALNLVPDQVPLKTMMPFLEGSVRSASQERRNASIVKSLRRSENFRVREENVRCKDRSFLVTFERACSICNRRIGTAAFVAYSSNVLAHYSCHKREEIQKARLSETLDLSGLQ